VSTTKTSASLSFLTPKRPNEYPLTQTQTQPGANVLAAWEKGYTGKNVVVRINDDGLDYTHPDFKDKFVQAASWSDPMPGVCKTEGDSKADTHGSTCGGIAVAAKNGECGVGVAYDAKVAGANIFRDSSNSNKMLQFGTCDSPRAHDISSNSWGADACTQKDGRRLEACPFLSTENNANTPCDLEVCDDWAAPSEDCNNAILEYCQDSNQHAATGFVDPACHDYYESWVNCEYNSLTTEQTASLRNAVTFGRKGRGIVFVFAAGNEFMTGEPMNSEGYTNSRYVITVGAIAGDNKHSLYASSGSCLLITAPGGDTDQAVNMYETLPVAEGKCRVGGPNAVGTSFATPVVTGVVALMLEANPKLGWRDVQDILVRSANSDILDDVCDQEKTPVSTNGAGLKHHNTLGFGKVDALAAVTMAEELAEDKCNIKYAEVTKDSDAASVDFAAEATGTMDIAVSSEDAAKLESLQHTVVFVSITHEKRGDLLVSLVSPSGVESVLSPVTPETTADFDSWKFMTVKNWGESGDQLVGNWQLKVQNMGSSEGSITSWKMNLYGNDASGDQSPTDLECGADDENVWSDVEFGDDCYTTEKTPGEAKPEDSNDDDEEGGDQVDGGSSAVRVAMGSTIVALAITLLAAW
jgi:subtilisin-like proprotein convertase family protein/subtilisin family serine protease